MRIKTNKIKCKKCGDIIESTHRHDFKFCKCKSAAVDGGKDYLKRRGNSEEIEELSEFEENDSRDLITKVDKIFDEYDEVFRKLSES